MNNALSDILIKELNAQFAPFNKAWRYVQLEDIHHNKTKSKLWKAYHNRFFTKKLRSNIMRNSKLWRFYYKPLWVSGKIIVMCLSFTK